ncbi:MAG TPA: TonB-dependent receptor [Bryobacteraceae bacterium]|nr:TonB-dependent receptor [Bryobacteraceae bacterium]
MKLLFTLSLTAISLSAASLSGTVKDPQGAGVPGATVTLYSPSGAAGTTTTSDSNGAYHFDGLPGGAYLLRAEAPGFAAFVAEDVRLDAAASHQRDIALDLARVHEQVVVTASSTPQLPEHVSKTIDAIDKSDADTRDAFTLSDVVSLAPGVRVNQLGGPGSFTSIRLRGMRDEDTAVLVDGLRLRDASATQADASGLIQDLLFTDSDRVEVLRGSASALYGTNAVGGAVNIITDEGGGRTRGSILLEGGSLGEVRTRAQIAGGLGDGRIQYSTGIAETDFTTGIGGNQPYRDASAQGRITFHLSPSLRLIARFYGADSFGVSLGEPIMLGTPSGFGIVNATLNQTFLPAPVNPDGTHAARFVSGAWILDGQASPRLDYSVSSQLVSNGRRYGDGPAGVGYQPGGNTRSIYDGRIETASAQAHYRLGRFHLLSGGYEFEDEHYGNDNSDTSNNAAANAVNVTQRSHSVFAQDQAQFFGGHLQISGAVRAQFFTLDHPAFQPTASAPYQGVAFPAPASAFTADGSVAYFLAHSGTKLRAHVGRGYRAPSLFERFGAGFDPVYGYSVYGDPRLKPEHSISLDAGIDQTLNHGRVELSAAYFYTWLQNVIFFDVSGAIDPTTDPFGRYVGYRNTQGGISRGLETSAALAVTRSLKLRSAYTYINAVERTPVVGDVLTTFVIPRHQVSFLLTEQPTSRLLFTCDTLASSSYLAPVYGDIVTQTYRFGGIHKFNLGASYRIPLKEYQALRFFARAENVFNQAYYESGFLTPGRTARTGVQWEF